MKMRLRAKVLDGGVESGRCRRMTSQMSVHVNIEAASLLEYISILHEALANRIHVPGHLSPRTGT